MKSCRYSFGLWDTMWYTVPIKLTYMGRTHYHWIEQHSPDRMILTEQERKNQAEHKQASMNAFLSLPVTANVTGWLLQVPAALTPPPK